MVATSRLQFPEDMTRAIQFPSVSNLETLAQDGLDQIKNYARNEPVKLALWAFGMGFLLGWKLKPW